MGLFLAFSTIVVGLPSLPLCSIPGSFDFFPPFPLGFVILFGTRVPLLRTSLAIFLQFSMTCPEWPLVWADFVVVSFVHQSDVLR